MEHRNIDDILADIKNPENGVEKLAELEKELNEVTEARRLEQEAIEKREALMNKALKTNKIVDEFKEERKDNQMETKDLRTMDVGSAEYRSAWLNALKSGELEQRTAFSGAAAIPTLTLNKIYLKLEQTSVLYPYISKTNLPGYLSIPVENAKNDAAWVAMGTAATDGADSLASVSLSLYKLIKTVEIGADNMAASIDAFEAFIVDALARKMAKAVDVAICTGDGSAKATGLLKANEITNTGTYTKTTMVFADLTKIIATIGAEYRKNARFAMPSALYFNSVIPALAAKGIGPDTQLAVLNRILGYEVILDDNITAGTIIFGDFQYYHWNWGQDVTIERDGSVGFRTGSA